MVYVMQTSIDPVLFCKYYRGKIEADPAYILGIGPRLQESIHKVV